MSSMAEDFQQYTDSIGLVQDRVPTPGQEATGNGLLFTAEAILVQESYAPLSETSRRAYVAAIAQCQAIPGLYNRWPRDLAQEGIDDYIGLGAASKHLLGDYGIRPTIVDNILEYGLQSKFQWSIFKFNYYYENQDPFVHTDTAAWLGRYPGFRAHMDFCNGEKSSMFWRFMWSLSIATAGLTDPKNNNNWTLPWVMVKCAPKDSIMCNLAIKYFNYRLKKHWGSMKAVFASYFADQNHPIIKWCKD